MALYQKIPLRTSVTDQTLSVEVDNSPYNLRVLWNEVGGYWSMTVATADDVAIISNVKMVKNYPLIGRFKDPLLPFGDFFLVQENGSADRPGYDDLGVSFYLYYYEPTVVDDYVAPVPLGHGDLYLGSVWDEGASAWDGGASGWDA